MRITVMTSTGDDDYINADETGDLEYRRQQLEQMRDEVVDLEDVSGGAAGITKTALIVVGDFLGTRYERSKLYDPAFATEYRPATEPKQ